MLRSSSSNKGTLRSRRGHNSSTLLSLCTWLFLIATSYICKYLCIYFIVAFSTNHNFFPFGPNLMLVTQVLSFFRHMKNRVCTRKVSFRYIAIPCLLALSADCLLNLHLEITEGTLCCYFIIQFYQHLGLVLGLVSALFLATNKPFSV
jgi:hypothetical protein